MTPLNSGKLRNIIFLGHNLFKGMIRVEVKGSPISDGPIARRAYDITALVF